MEAADLSRRLGDFYLVATEVLRDVNEPTEQQIKHWIVNPFLVTLGWDPDDKKQVYLDFPVKADGSHADYALLDQTGKPRVVMDVKRPPNPGTDSERAVKNARAINAPLGLVTNGQEFSLWYVSESEQPTPLFVFALKELADNAEALLGLTADYRVSDTGISLLRKSAIRSAVLQMLEENSEKTFDALVGWVQAQVAPGALDESTDEAIREATMMWLNEEHLTMAMFAPGPNDKKFHELRVTTAKDWESFPRGPTGTFQYKYDSSKTLDLRQSPKEVKESLRRQGFKTSTATSFGGFYYALRQRAGLKLSQ
jgi:uncharacterized protein YcgL (UPF0745 family)